MVGSDLVGVDAAALAVLVVGIAVGVGVLRFAVFRRHAQVPRERRELARVLDERLAEDVPAGRGTHLEDPPHVRRIAVLGPNEDGDDGDDGDPLVPIVRIDLGTVDAPRMNLIFEYVVDALEAIHPVLADRDERIRCYDVEFSFGPDGLFVAGERRRVSVPPDLAERLCEDGTYRAVDLRRDVERRERAQETGSGTKTGTAALWAEPRDG